METTTARTPAIEPALARRVAAGDSHAVEECYRRLRPMVLGYLRRYLSLQEAEDVAQIAFLEVWRSLDRYDPNRSLEAWVLGIARKRAIDQLRRSSRGAAALEQLKGFAQEDSVEFAERFVRAQQVQTAMRVLPVEQQEALHLVYYVGLTQAEVAEKLGVPLGTVKARVFRGLQRMHRMMASGWDEEGGR